MSDGCPRRGTHGSSPNRVFFGILARAMSALIDVTAGMFESEVLRSEKPVLVEFWAPWCGPCHTMKPILKEFSEAETARIKVVLINTQDHPELANRFGVMAIPTFLVFRDGNIAGQYVGAMNRDRLAQFAGIS